MMKPGLRFFLAPSTWRPSPPSSESESDLASVLVLLLPPAAPFRIMFRPPPNLNPDGADELLAAFFAAAAAAAAASSSSDSESSPALSSPSESSRFLLRNFCAFR